MSLLNLTYTLSESLVPLENELQEPIQCLISNALDNVSQYLNDDGTLNFPSENTISIRSGRVIHHGQIQVSTSVPNPKQILPNWNPTTKNASPQNEIALHLAASHENN